MKVIFNYLLVLFAVTSCMFNQQGSNASNTSTAELGSAQERCKTDSEEVIKSFVHDEGVICNDSLTFRRIVGDYDIEIIRVPNSTIVTRYYSDGVSHRFSDNSIYMTVHYKGKTLFKNKKFTKEMFSHINPEDLKLHQLMPSNYFDAKVEGDTLKTWFAMIIPDSDLSHEIFINVSSTGDISYYTIQFDGGEGFIEW